MIRYRSVSATLILGLAVTMLSGCAFLPRITGGNPTPTPSPTPTPTAVSTEEAATAFTDTICTFNDAAFAFDETWSNLEAPLRQLQEAAALSKTEAQTAKQELQEVNWPEEIADDIVVIEGYFDERIEKLDQVIDAQSLEELDTIDFSTPDDVNEAATRVEEHLQLGVDYCPVTEEPGDPVDVGAELGDTTWSGTDSDGDDTEIYFGTDGSASATVGGTVYDGTWELAEDGLLTIDVSSTNNSLAFNGFYEPGATSLSLSGTATNGHTWTVDLQRL